MDFVEVSSYDVYVYSAGKSKVFEGYHLSEEMLKLIVQTYGNTENKIVAVPQILREAYEKNGGDK